MDIEGPRICLRRFDDYNVYELQESNKVDVVIAVLVSRLASIINCKNDQTIEPNDKKKQLNALKYKVLVKIKELEGMLLQIENSINEEIVKTYINYNKKYMPNILNISKDSNDPGFKYLLVLTKTKPHKILVKHNKGNINTIHDLNSYLCYINRKIRNSDFSITVTDR